MPADPGAARDFHPSDAIFIMPKLTIDNQALEVPAGTTILQAARVLGIDIPTLCHREGCRPETSCLVCVVRVNGRPRLLPACATEVAEGMVVESETAEIHRARRAALELLLSEHRGDCLAPCQLVCPAHLDIPAMLRLVQQGRMAEAVALVKQHIPIPSILGRICPELCERGCRRGQMDAPVSIKLLKRYVGDWDRAQEQPWAPALALATGRRVAIVGAGPAGLSAAYYLRQRGHEVVLFDDHDQPGGGLRYGVSPEQLPPEVLDSELRGILQPGLEVRRATLGQTLALAELQRDFDAVLLALGQLGAEQAEGLGLPYAHRGLQIDADTLQTPLPGVFACGSAVAPSQHAARAVGSGRLAAEAIDAALRTGAAHVKREHFNVHLGKLAASELLELTAGVALTPRAQTDGPLSAEQATAETRRCLHCECAGLDKCRLRQWAARYGADPRAYGGAHRQVQRDLSHPYVVYEPGKCITCGLCVQIASREQEPLGLTFIGRGFSVRIGVPWSESLAEGLQAAAQECAAACPTGAIVLAEEKTP